MTSSAEFSPCGKYRYQLKRIWDDRKPFAMCIGLNPSKAGAVKPDATITRLTKSLYHLGFGGLMMTNLYAIVSTDPKKLITDSPEEELNISWLKVTAAQCQKIIYCWGGFKQAKLKAPIIRELFPDGYCFGIAADGSPWHPLAMMYAGLKVNQAELVKYSVGMLDRCNNEARQTKFS